MTEKPLPSAQTDAEGLGKLDPTIW